MSDSASKPGCFATLLTTDSYLHGALTLAASIRQTGTSHAIVCLVAEGQLSKPALERLSLVFDRVVSVPVLDTQDYANLALLGRPDLGTTATKIAVWSLTEYSRIVYLDADTLVLQNIDSLLEEPTNESGLGMRPNGGMQNEGMLAAAPDLGWPDCFNSGVFVAKPSKTTHDGLLRMLATQGSFDGGDQGLLNAYFSDWSRADHTRRLPFSYNTTSTSFYTYAPAFARFSSDIKVVHFIGPHKPWKRQRLTNGYVMENGGSLGKLVDKWWSIHDTYVSLWTTDVLFDSLVALSLSDTFKGGISTVQSEESLDTPHAMDDAWKRERGNHSSVDERALTNDNWGSFTPAADFALSGTSSLSSSSSALGRSTGAASPKAK
ncbi:glycogenin glucosyltransferase [Coemansia erecta]|uniref:Glycogenin glucosyltransferase n=1 Tax=Coemansia asiatica TaxID=1052880 RepID=A0A9W7XH76_9FUNG|nr:glycogenin glucosyltransferase [Coemansia asiatica]KAJ2857524.1 glycogenin glucosyltransferase [Coemansia erecta]KAJ2884353.1 glycogenin glucosyltransferase [Coemansia asiatica]